MKTKNSKHIQFFAYLLLAACILIAPKTGMGDETAALSVDPPEGVVETAIPEEPQDGTIPDVEQTDGTGETGGVEETASPFSWPAASPTVDIFNLPPDILIGSGLGRTVEKDSSDIIDSRQYSSSIVWGSISVDLDPIAGDFSGEGDGAPAGAGDGSTGANFLLMRSFNTGPVELNRRRTVGLEAMEEGLIPKGSNNPLNNLGVNSGGAEGGQDPAGLPKAYENLIEGPPAPEPADQGIVYERAS